MHMSHFCGVDYDWIFGGNLQKNKSQSEDNLSSIFPPMTPPPQHYDFSSIQILLGDKLMQHSFCDTFFQENQAFSGENSKFSGELTDKSYFPH